MPKMIATQSFLNNGKMVRKGDTIDVTPQLADEYRLRKLAKEEGEPEMETKALSINQTLQQEQEPKRRQTRKKKEE